MNILIIDPDAKFARSLKDALSKNFAVHSCFEISDAKSMLLNHDFNLILSEYRDAAGREMGRSFLKILKASEIKVPLIFLSANTDITHAVECIKEGAIDFMDKSVPESQMLERIHTHIRNLSNGKEQLPSRDVTEIPLRILIVDDNANFSDSVRFHFRKKYQVDSINEFPESVNGFMDKHYDLYLLDIKDELKLDPRAGVKLLQKIIDAGSTTPVIMLSGWADTSVAVECLKMGALDFIEKTLKNSEVLNQLEMKINKIISEKGRLHNPENSLPRYRLIDIIGESDKMEAIRNLCVEIASESSPVLISGETGTGKEMVASAIHHSGSRRTQNFVIIDCSTIPENIFESEFFGHAKGAFTGAQNAHKGKLSLAHGGTLFLDEIENLSLEQQAKLLRVIEEKNFFPVGSNILEEVDFRIICATNVNLEEMVRDRKFREDLYHRINVYHIELPPLRQRGEKDLILLISHFKKQFGIIKINELALDILMAYEWPGNVRELRNMLKKMNIQARSLNKNSIDVDIVKEAFRGNVNDNGIIHSLNEILDHYNTNISGLFHILEDLAVERAYREFNGNLSKIAEKVYSEGPADTRNYRDRARKVLARNNNFSLS